MFKLPSRKTLETAFPGKGKELRQLLRGDSRTYSYESVKELCRVCYSHPKYPMRLMEALNEILDGHGVEALIPISEEHPSYEYVNMGDIYHVTILLRNDGKVIVGSCGDMVEQHMEWYP